MIELLVAALAVAAISAAAGLAVRHRRKRLAAAEEVPALPAHRRVDLGELQPADVVAHLGAHYLVEGVAIIDEGVGASLVVASMAGDDLDRYLVVEPRSGAAPVLAERREPVGAGRALPSCFHEGGFEWRLARRASARAEVSGELERPPAGPCEFGRYEGPGGRVGYVVLAEGKELALSGRAVTAEGLTLLPGGDATD